MIYGQVLVFEENIKYDHVYACVNHIIDLCEKQIYFLEKNYKFKDFINSQKFIDKVGEISEKENHHPDILFGWGYAKVMITTHAIEGLSENDFILAAKIDQIFNA